MDTMQAITTRRSIRKFKDTPLNDAQIWKYLEAANMAPSASNRQPWRFIVVKRQDLDKIEKVLDASFLERIEDYSKQEYQEYKERLEALPIPGMGDKEKNMQSFFKRLGGAPVAIIVYVNNEADPWRSFVDVQDCSAAIQNLILAAWADGVGSCWMCAPLIKKGEAIKEFFGIPDKKLIALIPLGYPDIYPSPPPKDKVQQKTLWF